MRKEDEEIEAKCPLSGISCRDCKWRIEYEKIGYKIYGFEDGYHCFVVALIFELHGLNETLSALLKEEELLEEETPVKRRSKR
jgi:hypothetical protein